MSGAARPAKTVLGPGGISVRGRAFGVLAAIAIAASVGALSVQAVRAAGQTKPSGARCATDPFAPALTPQVVFDSTPHADGSAARYGSLQYGRGPIKPYEIAITIDDGPDAALHQRVLDILDQHCIKATFFFVGRNVTLHPEMVRASAARGHVVATHSLTHPNNLRRYSRAAEAAQIRGGFEAVEAALASSPPQDRARLAPFFRFPGLNGSPWMLDYLGARRIAVFSSDFGTDDWRGISPAEIEQRAIRYANESKGGIVIMHETRPHMVEELSTLIVLWETQGYRFVQAVPEPDARATSQPSRRTLLSRLVGDQRHHGFRHYRARTAERTRRFRLQARDAVQITRCRRTRSGYLPVASWPRISPPGWAEVWMLKYHLPA